MRTLVGGSRGSKLALRQTQQIVDAISRLRPDLSCRIEVIKTKGDAVPSAPLNKLGGMGLFVKDIEKALLRDEIDFAVHSAKDMPTEMDPRLQVAAYPQRDDPRDALVSRVGTLSQMPPGSRIGTGSPRRGAQLLHARPDLNVVETRGNLDTRLRKLEEGQYEAVILAHAGLIRLGWDSLVTEVLPTDICLPAAGQGALAVQCRADDPVTGLLAEIDDEKTRRCVEAERAVLRRVGTGCSTPVGVLAQIVEEGIMIEAVLGSADGSVVVRERLIGDTDAPEAACEQLAERLLASAGPLIRESYASGGFLPRS